MISIIIISYNGRDLLKKCLLSIYKNLTGKFEVIVVDHNSHDKSIEMVRSNFPKVTVIDAKKNPGFGTGCNKGAETARGNVLLFLNSDTEIIDNSVFEMEKFLRARQNIGITGGLLKNYDDSDQRSCGRFYTLPNVALMLFGGEKLELAWQNTKTEKEVDWVSGGFMMVKKSVFDMIHGFDEKIFMYIEDMELCYRVKKAGYSVVFYPKCQVIHKGQGASSRQFAIIHIYQGLEYFYKKHKSPREYVVLKWLLITKAYFAMGFGIITLRHQLFKTYKRALQIV